MLITSSMSVLQLIVSENQPKCENNLNYYIINKYIKNSRFQSCDSWRGRKRQEAAVILLTKAHYKTDHYHKIYSEGRSQSEDGIRDRALADLY